MNETSKTSIPDSPKLAAEEDSFGIEQHEKGLIKFISNCDTPITIALQGEWGSGKTSLMNSLKESLCCLDDSKYHSIWLNTWEYALMKDSQSTLIDIVIALIEEISKIVDKDKSKLSKYMKGRVSISKDVLKAFVKGVANNTLDGAGEAVDAVSSKDRPTIGSIRKELKDIIAECIKKDNKKDNKKGFIFFIDDLDRIDPPVAVQLLELLKNIFTLENCVFVLAIDYDVVVKGLKPKFGEKTGQNEREFRSFFDKIIQVPFSMPVERYETDSFLQESLLSIGYIDEAQSGDGGLISSFASFLNLSVGKNPRSLKRLINSLSLISCINSEKEKTEEENDNLDSDLELLVNFALVSIQIAYKPVYDLLLDHPSFDEWDDSVASQINLKELDEESIAKLEKMEEFNEPWEQVLYRLCGNDHYLKKRAFDISRLLNEIRSLIKGEGESIEGFISSVISYSAVTNTDTKEPVKSVEYHRSSFLKELRNRLINQLKKDLPEVANIISPQGKRVQSNALIKFTEGDWGHWIRLHSHSYTGKIRLIISSGGYERHISFNGHNEIQDLIKEVGLEEEFKKLENDYNHNQYILEYPDFSALKFYDKVAKNNGCFEIHFYSYLILPTTDSFYELENIEKISLVIAEMYHFGVRLEKLKGKVDAYYQGR